MTLTIGTIGRPGQHPGKFHGPGRNPHGKTQNARFRTGVISRINNQLLAADIGQKPRDPLIP
jgi:hypothetical protein